jgi:hypothetical protein
MTGVEILAWLVAADLVSAGHVVPDALGKGGAGETTGSDHLRGNPAGLGRADARLAEFHNERRRELIGTHAGRR